MIDRRDVISACLLSILLCASAASEDGGVQQTTYANGKPRSEVTRKAGVKHGVQTLWTVTGGRSTRTFVGGVEHGPATSYFDNGRKMYEGQYAWGLKTGTWTDYDLSGARVFSKAYAHGKLHGVVTQYGAGSGPKRGQLVPVRVSRRVFGIEHGDVVESWHDGTLRAQGRLVGGKQHGTWTYYDATGARSRQVRYVCGKKLDADGVEEAAGDAGDGTTCGPVKVSLSSPRSPLSKAASLEESTAATRAGLAFQRDVCEALVDAPGFVVSVAGRPLRCPGKLRFRSKTPADSGVRG